MLRLAACVTAPRLRAQGFLCGMRLLGMPSVLQAASQSKGAVSRVWDTVDTQKNAHRLSKIHKKLKPPDRVREAGRRPRRQRPGAVGRAAPRRLEVGGHGRQLVGLQRHVE